ncbi:hypothetical protein X271_00221 [Candidatus Hepatoplasma crinochetorum Av]|uniref:Uncharacterized protein n=1 Tax=Candidatus Hepatoplasma crinochetorum Av TaxID=1427984 RepID=W8GSB3_9MOLU|nr:hypothetical protein [Candidatus Hepatoplasma crinochetorum]AHK22330.1 hypothetical protein X271_00221 [Candidatus Hepatoplasma crinochetorum Av]
MIDCNLIEELIIKENLYLALNNYYDFRSKFSFRNFILNLDSAYLFFFTYFLEKNKIPYKKENQKNKDKTKEVEQIYNDFNHYIFENKLFELPKNFKKNYETLRIWRNIFYHNPFPDSKNKYYEFNLKYYTEKNWDKNIKKLFLNFTNIIISNYIYFYEKIFNKKIDVIYPFYKDFSFSDNFSEKMQKVFLKIPKLKEIDNFYNENLFFINKINPNDYYGSEKLLKNILDDFIYLKYRKSYLNKKNEATGSEAYKIYYCLNIHNDFYTNINNRKWIQKYHFPQNKLHGINLKAYHKDLIPYIKYIVDNFDKFEIRKRWINKKPFLLSEIKKWNIEKYR